MTNIPSSKIFHCFLLSVKFLKSSGENCWCSSLLWKYKCWSATDGRWKAFLLTIFAGFIVYVINFISLTLGKLFKSLSGTALYQKSLYIWQLHLTQVKKGSTALLWHEPKICSLEECHRSANWLSSSFFDIV